MRRYMRSAALKRHTRAALLCSSGRIRPIVPATLKINSDTWMGDWRKRPTVPKWIKATNMSARKAAWHAVYRALEETTSSGGEFQTSLRSETDWMMMTTEVTCRRKVELFSRNLWRYMRAAFQQKPALTPSSEDARDVSRFSLSLRCVLPLNTLSARAVASFSPSSSSSSSFCAYAAPPLSWSKGMRREAGPVCGWLCVRVSNEAQSAGRGKGKGWGAEGRAKG
mmetsp:Transcript_1963/g.4840  ORF Transcript_1963/g.4840 Transcript_1963/m.4840 type:complete len:224 (+) Transcript_1963:679-1350(+)